MKALAFLRKALGDRDRGLAPITDARKITYADLRSGLLASYVERGNRSLATRADGEETIAGLPQLDSFFKFEPKNPSPSVMQITVDTGRAFVKARQSEDPPAGAAVINRSLACLRRMLRIAHEDGKIQNVPVIRLLKEPPAREGFLEMKEFEELVGLLPAHLQPLITFLYYDGVRLGVALQIEWPEVDLHRRIVRLHETKNDEPRVVPLPSVLVNTLREVTPKVGPVFDSTNLRKEWTKACAARGLGRIIKVEGKKYDPRYEGLIVHDLRRSAVRNLVNAGVPETVAMKISGHKTRSVFDRYAIASETDLTKRCGASN
ncbi:MAG TPA: site-specific integrase [Candidatus Sulfotelmatobacter sp.]|jgi:integrase|nr:site-specific integrase [Candidatus Sulfotelmatobacter sp.]